LQVKNVIDDFAAVAADPRFKFAGNVALGLWSKPAAITLEGARAADSDKGAGSDKGDSSDSGDSGNSGDSGSVVAAGSCVSLDELRGLFDGVVSDRSKAAAAACGRRRWSSPSTPFLRCWRTARRLTGLWACREPTRKGS
jgi:hypothetical protein